MAVTYWSTGPIAQFNSTPTSVQYPALVDNDRLAVLIGFPKIGNTALASQPSIAGWDSQGWVRHGTTASGNDAGSMAGMVWTRVCNGTEGGTSVSVPWGFTPFAGQAFIVLMAKDTVGSSTTYDVAVSAVARTATDANWSVTHTLTGAIPGDSIVVANAVPTDLVTASSSGTLSASGATFSFFTPVVAHQISSTGTDSATWADNFTVSTGPSTTGATYASTLTSGTNRYGVSLKIRVRELTPAPTRTATATSVLPTFSQSGAGSFSVPNLGTSYGPALSSMTYIGSAATTSSALDLAIHPLGGRLYVLATDVIHQYPLATPWQVSSKGTGSSFTLGGTLDRSIQFNPDGSKLYYMTTGGSVRMRPLSRKWDISTLGAQDATTWTFPVITSNPTAMAFSSDGMYLFGWYGSDDRIRRHALGTAWDLSTVGASADQTSVQLVTYTTQAAGMHFAANGKRVYIADRLSTEEISQYDLSSAWDLSTMDATREDSLNVAARTTDNTTFFPAPTGRNAYLLANDGTVFQYDAPPLLTATAVSTLPTFLSSGTGTFSNLAIPPVAAASATPSMVEDALTVITLDGTSSSDPNGTISSYSWSLISAPTGYTGTFSAPTSAITTFTPSLVGVQHVGALGSAQNRDGTSTVALTVGTAVPIGGTVVVWVASDNINDTQPTFSATDTKGNTYTQVAQGARNGTLMAGISGGMLIAPVTSALTTSDTITVTLSPAHGQAAFSKAIFAEAFTGVTTTLRGSANQNIVFATSVSVSDTTPVSGDLVIAGVAVEAPYTDLALDSDTTNGPWSTGVLLDQGQSTTTQNATVAGQWKIVTDTGTQSWDIQLHPLSQGRDAVAHILTLQKA